MSYEPMNPAELGAVLSMIGTGNGWPTKARIVGLIGAHEGGAWWTAPEVADFIGKSPGRTSVLLAQLADERVILRDGGDGGRVFWCEVNPDLARWKVPWVHHPRQVREKLARYRELEAETVLERFIFRPMHARCVDAIARLMGARSAPDHDPSPRGLGARDVGGSGGSSSRGQSARSRSGLRLVQGRAVNRGTSPKSSPLESDDTSGSSWVGEGQRTTKVDPATEATAKGAVLAKAVAAPGRRKFINGEPLDLLQDLLKRHDLDAVLAAVDAAEPDQVPGLMQAVQIALDHPGAFSNDDELQAHTAAVERKRYLLARIPRLLELLEVDPDNESLQHERVECENELQRLDEGAA